jgi:hypothetical protein
MRYKMLSLIVVAMLLICSSLVPALAAAPSDTPPTAPYAHGTGIIISGITMVMNCGRTRATMATATDRS